MTEENASSTTCTVSEFTYDSLGNVTQVSAPGVTSSNPLVTTYDYEYDGATVVQDPKIGQPVAVTDPLGHINHYRYDTQGRLLTATDPAGHTTTNTYNLAGQIATATLPATGQTGPGLGGIAYTYLYMGGPNTGTAIYDEAANAVRTTYTLYGKEGELKEVGGDMADPVHYRYDEMLRLTEIANPADRTLSYYFYDQRGDIWAELLVNTNDPTDRVQRSYTYDDMGNLTRQEDAYSYHTPVPKRILRFTYDSTDFKPTGVYADDELTVPIATFTYDSWRRMASRTDREGVQEFSYGDADALQSVTTTYTGLPSKTVSYTYKHNGARATMGTPAGTFTYGYDTTGRPTTLTNPLSETTNWAYESVRGLLESQTSANGIVASYVYDALGRPTQITNKDASANIVSQFTVSSSGGFDGAGNRLEVTANVPSSTALSGVTDWTYDNQNRLTAEVSARAGGWNHTHGYDAAGNLTTLRGQSQTYDYQNQLTGGTGLGSFEYDERGNPTTFNGVSLSWDEQDNLTTVGSATSPTLTAGYSADGLRAWKDSGTSKTYFLYDGTSPILEMDDSGNALALNTLGANGLVSRWEQSKDSSTSGMTGATDATEGNLSGTAFYSFDERGNVSDVDYANSSYTDVLGTAYDAYGIGGSGLGVFAFGGKFGYYTDSETGLVLCTYRYYDPNTGRWLNRDPISYKGGLNVYAYVNGNPVNSVDPSGHNPISVKAQIVAALAQGNVGYAVWILRTAIAGGATGMGTALSDKFANSMWVRITQQVAQNYVNKFQPSDMKCVDTAENLYMELDREGVPAQTVDLAVKGGELVGRVPVSWWERLLGKTGEVFTNTGYHKAVEVGGRIFDSLTGPKGLPAQEYMNKFNLEKIDWYTLPYHPQ